jgi:predicted HicB family RNase H-like nuclease
MNNELQKQARRYIKVVEWSDEGGCFVGQCPELFAGGCHGADEAKVYKELCSMVEEVLEDMAADGRTPHAPLAAQKFSGKFMFRPGESLHKALAIRAFREHKSLNQVCVDAIRAGVS